MDAFLFDLDGTLIDSFEDIIASANHARHALGLAELPADEIRPMIGEGARRLIERAIGPENLSRIDQALAAWREHYRLHMLDHTRPYDGIAEALAGLAGPCAVVTNKPGENARRLVRALELGRFFQVVLGEDDVGARKPDPRGVALALTRLPTCQRAVLIGDSAVDAETARAAGVGFVGVLWGLGREEALSAAGARIFVRHPRELGEACGRALSGAGTLQDLQAAAS